jgi:hypothetical protein
MPHWRPSKEVPMAGIKTWEAMRERSERLLVQRTGEDLAEWSRRVLESGIDGEPELRAWLNERGVTGYGQMLVVMERFGYPDFLSASADELIDGQYADRESLRPIMERVLGAVAGLAGAQVQARKTYITLATERRKFAVLKATTKSRVDLGLRIAGIDLGGRLVSAKPFNDPVLTVRVQLAGADEVDDEVVELLGRAHAESS